MTTPIEMAICDQPPRQHFVFWTLPNYSLIAMTSAIDALRVANRVIGAQEYHWSIVTANGAAVASSCGLTLLPTQSLDCAWSADFVFVCGGESVASAFASELKSTLRQLARSGIPIGALCTGTHALAWAGLLENFRAAVHWESLPALRECYPKTTFCEDLFIIDRNRATCSGGVAPLHLILELVGKRLGENVSSAAARLLILDRVRPGADRQVVPLKVKVGEFRGVVLRAAALMEANVEDLLTLDEIARNVGVSRRQVERLFKRYVGQTPTSYYQEVRFRRARELLVNTSLSTLEILIACGFKSATHFSHSYRKRFGHSPTDERRGKDSPLGSRAAEATGLRIEDTHSS